MHRHRWQPSAVRRYVFSEYGDLAKPTHHYTYALYVCEICRKTKVEKLAGHWTLEELRGPNKRKP